MPITFRAALCELAPALAHSRAHQWHGLSQAVVAVYTGDGGRIDRPRLDASYHAITMPFYR
jgi:hypothetical protein